jgi:hypothetical protein
MNGSWGMSKKGHRVHYYSDGGKALCRWAGPVDIRFMDPPWDIGGKETCHRCLSIWQEHIRCEELDRRIEELKKNGRLQEISKKIRESLKPLN